jgi:hypothetical protein
MTTSYNMIDRFLRNNLSDKDYPSHKEALDAICQAKLQRTLVGLTEEEIGDEYVRFEVKGGFNRFEYAVRAIESKLKEVNT